MGFPSSVSKPMLAEVFREVQSLARDVRQRAQSTRDRLVAGEVLVLEVLDLQATLKQRLDRLNAIRATPGLPAYARDQVDDQALDIAGEFDTMLGQIQTTLDLIRGNLPVSSDGFAKARKIEADDTTTNLALTPTQSNSLRVRLDNLIASID